MPKPIEPADLPKEGEVISRFAAQRRLGLFAKLDWTVFGFLVLSWTVTGFYWGFRPEPNFTAVLAVLLASILASILWLIVLVYRVLVWILDIQADINLMPESAARIVLGYYEGRKK
jgi:hypothetical protein